MERTEVIELLQGNIAFCNTHAHKNQISTKEQQNWIRLFGYLCQISSSLFKEEEIRKRLEAIEYAIRKKDGGIIQAVEP